MFPRVNREMQFSEESDGKTKAYCTMDPPTRKLAEFYKMVLERQEMFRTKYGSIHLSDGEIN